MGEKTNVHVGGYGSKKAGGVSGRKMAALVGAGMVVALLAVAGAWYLMADRVKEDLADALLRAEVAVAEQDYVRAKKILEAAIADVPSRADKAALTGAARKRLQEIAGNAAEQEQARAKAGAERKERDRQAIETKAKGEHERDAVAVLDKVKALLNGGDYEAAKDLALESVGRFADTSFGVEFPKLLEKAAMQLKGAEQAAKEKADAERKRLEAKAKARRERFIRHRDEGIAAFRAKDYETAKIALGNALKEEQDADIQAMLDDAIDRTMRHPIAVADFRVLAPDIDRSAGQALAERLLSRFQARYQVIERAQLATYLNEVDLTMADIVHNPALLKGKKLRGVRYLVMGSINRFGDLAVSARVVDIVRNPGAHKQSHQITGSSLAILNDQLDELAKVLQMTNEEKDDYLPGRGELPVPTIASTDPSDPGWWLDRATQLARAIADQDKQAALLKEIVLARSESGRSDLAVALIQSLRDPRERAVAYTLGMTVAARRRDKLGVRRFLEKARSCVRNQPPPFVLSLLALACIESCFSAGDRDSAQAVLEVYGDVAKQSLGKGTSSNLRAFLAALRGDLKEAESIAEGASDTNTKDLAHAYIVRALSAVRDLPRAKQFLKRIAASTRAHREAYAYLVIAMAQSGDATGASDVLGGEDFPFGTIYAVRAALGIGRVQLKAGDLEGFRATLSWQAAVSAALLTDPHLECEAYSGIAHLYAYAGDAPAARKSLEKAREAYGKLEGKEGTGFLREIGHVQAMLGDIEDALAMAKNIKNEPERLQALLEIGKGLGETATKVDLDSIARRLGNDIERAYFSIGVAVGLANKPGTP